MNEVDNIMLSDEYWDEEDYHCPSKARMCREKELYDRTELEDFEDEYEGEDY